MILMTFATTHTAMGAELSADEFRCRLVPLPPSISAGCGLALLCPQDNPTPIVEHLEAVGLSPEEVYRKHDKAYEVIL